jgi:hypothetical protein
MKKKSDKWRLSVLLAIICLAISMQTCDRLPMPGLAEGIGFWDLTTFGESKFAP